MHAEPGAVPGATYRLQLGADLDFDGAAGLAPYLAELGATHVYTSPYLQAAAGSTHGYDGVDPTRVSEELGGDAGRARFVEALRAAGLGHVVDIVPNHLGITDRRNRWWFDVLRHGRDSAFAAYFDIDWDGADPAGGKILLPILGRPLAEELAAGSLGLERAGGDWIVRYHDTVLPVAPGTGPGGAADDPAALAALLDRQHYALVPWQEGLDRLRHRRFFDITTLAGLRVEDPEVFDAVHALVLDWVRAGEVDGLRVDHIDGLADPVGYLERLADAAPTATRWVEKILVGDEQLEPSWPIAGTTGYDALAELTEVLVHRRGVELIGAAYEAITGDTSSWADTVHRARTHVVRELLRPEVGRCAAHLRRAASLHDLEIDDDHARSVVAAFAVELPVYRTYAWPGRPTSLLDREVIVDAVDAVIARHPEAMARAMAVIADALLHPCEETADLVRTLQQLTGPAMAKGVEDTAFYRDTRFVALNEVGGGPERSGCDVDTFHRRAAMRAAGWPAAMVTTSTHDTKRSEDVRARLAVLSEIPDRWAATLARWCERSARWWPDGVEPDRPLDVLVHQTVVGADPLPADRAHRFLEKAMREAKLRTSWLHPDTTFERAAHDVLDQLLQDPQHQREVHELAAELLLPGRVNALAQKLLALTMPGVPDIYQGSELWNLDLVDPDNRRPVDADLRRRLLAELPAEPVAADAARWRAGLEDPADPGMAKLAVVHHALRVRRDHRACFAGPDAGYMPVAVVGPAADHAIAFARGDRVVTVVPRHTVRLAGAGGWGDTCITLPGSWRSVLDGRAHTGTTAVAEILDPFPVALMVRV
jgi:(1->4)-alpha-D-glucan 1-alpha-D-glucosylmutase